MNATLQQILPVVVSILVIIAVAILQSVSKPVAAITATMPLGIPLALWIVYAAEKGDRGEVARFTGAMVPGLGATLVFTCALWLAARAGWSLVPMLAAGYLAWAGTLLITHLLRTIL